MRRREFLQATVALAAGCGASPVAIAADVAIAAGIAEKYVGLDTERYLTDLKVLTKVVDRKVFTEGPCCDRSGNVYFTNAEASKILKWDGRELSVFRADKNAANGLLFDRQGRLVACEGDAGRVTRTDMKTGQITVLVDQYDGRRLGLPNDLSFDLQGRIYFTSRLPNTDPDQARTNAVYRIDPDGKVDRLLQAPTIHMPNGIVTSPDDTTLYVVESDSRADRHRCILAFDLHSDGQVSHPRTLIDFYPGRSGDGMAIDEQGNLYVAAGLHKTRGTSETLDTRPGIHVVSPAGKLLAFVETPEDTITNCRFGGPDLKTLYVTCGSLLLSLTSRIPGKALYRPEE
jgi:gluconolactonase